MGGNGNVTIGFHPAMLARVIGPVRKNSGLGFLNELKKRKLQRDLVEGDVQQLFSFLVNQEEKESGFNCGKRNLNWTSGSSHNDLVFFLEVGEK